MASFGARLYGTGATAARFALEITAFGTITYLVSEYGYKPTTESILHFTDLFAQSRSLEAEFSEILSAVESVYYSKLAAPHNSRQSGRERIISKADLDEFRWNITSHNTYFDELCLIKKSNSPLLSRKVIEKYRAVPLSELHKMKTEATLRKGRPAISEGVTNVAEENSVIDVLQTVVDVNILIKKYSTKFNQQQLRVERELMKRKSQACSPDEAAYEESTVLLQSFVGYTVFAWIRSISNPVQFAKRFSFAYGGLFGCYLFLAHNVVEKMICGLNQDLFGFDTTIRRGYDDDNKNTFLYTNFFYPSYDPINMKIIPGLDLNDDVDGESEDEDANENYLDLFRNSFIGDIDDDDVDGHLSIPPIWPGGTVDDPFTFERMRLNLFEKPVFNEIIFRSILFTRLASIGGIVPAGIVTTIIHAIYFTDSNYDVASKLNHLTTTNALIKNLITSGILTLMYVYTGNIYFTILLNCAFQSNSLLQEFHSRGDLIKEKLKIWPYLKEMMLIDTVLSHYHLYPRYYLVKYGILKDINGVTKNGQPTQIMKEAVNSVIENFSTVKNNEIDNKYVKNDIEDKNTIRMSANDLYDFLESFYYVIHKNKLPGEKNLFTHITNLKFFSIAYPDEVKTVHQEHYSCTNKLPPNSYGLRREDYLRDYLIYIYPNGLTKYEVEEYLLLLFTTMAHMSKEPIDIKKIINETMKWEMLAKNKETNNNNEEFLDLMQMVHIGFLNRIEVEAVKFGIWRSAALLEELAGRRADADDIRNFQEKLGEWMKYGNKRAEIDALLDLGLTTERYVKLLKLFFEKDKNGTNDNNSNNHTNKIKNKVKENMKIIVNDNEMVKLKKEWDQYFTGPLFRKRIHHIVNPFGGKSEV